eukprot:9519664-Alexandrium_andersonii.AAC.1
MASSIASLTPGLTAEAAVQVPQTRRRFATASSRSNDVTRLLHTQRAYAMPQNDCRVARRCSWACLLPTHASAQELR